MRLNIFTSQIFNNRIELNKLIKKYSNNKILRNNLIKSNLKWLKDNYNFNKDMKNL